jgi:hypothetical protein
MMLNPAVKIALEKYTGTPFPDRSAWGGWLGWLEDNHSDVYLELYLIDCAGSGILFGDPHHSISWNIATRAAAGDPLAMALCQALNVLSPNHCQKTLDDEGS